MIGELIGDWIKGILIDGIMGNLSGLFSTVNTKVGEIASDVWQIVQCCFNYNHRPMRWWSAI